MIGKLERVALREVWPHEATRFTPWLQENIDVLGEVLDLTFSSAEREQSTGSFNVDILAETEGGESVIIESQFGRSDHDHLGKLLTYLTSFESNIAIWIVEEPRNEHIHTISWLNESTSGTFYLVKVEAVRIDTSPPAPLFTLIVGPSEESREVGVKKMELSDRHRLRRNFFSNLLDRAKGKSPIHANISPSTSSYVSAGAGKRGLSFNYVVHQHDTQIELYIDRGKEMDEENLKIYNYFLTSKDEIEKSFGDPLNWEILEGRRACRVSKAYELGGWRDEEKWPVAHDAMIDGMIRLERAMRPFIEGLRI